MSKTETDIALKIDFQVDFARKREEEEKSTYRNTESHGDNVEERISYRCSYMFSFSFFFHLRPIGLYMCPVCSGYISLRSSNMLAYNHIVETTGVL